MIQTFFHNDTVSVLQDTDTLKGFVRKVMDNKNLTAREVERRSSGGVTHSYVNKIKNGDATNPSPSVLQALAKGLGESEEILFALVRGKSPERSAIRNETLAFIDSVYSSIPEKDREAIDVLLEVVHQEIQRRQLNFRYSSEMEKDMLKIGNHLVKEEEIIGISKVIERPGGYKIRLRNSEPIEIPRLSEGFDSADKIWKEFESQVEGSMFAAEAVSSAELTLTTTNQPEPRIAVKDKGVIDIDKDKSAGKRKTK